MMGYQPKLTAREDAFPFQYNDPFALDRRLLGEQNPPQSVSAIIPYGQAPGDVKPEPQYEEMLISYPEVKVND